MNLLKKYQKILSLSIGIGCIIVYFTLYFWNNSKGAVLSENELAARNVARMEANVHGSTATSSSSNLKSMAFTPKEVGNDLLLLLLIIGVGFSAYGFIKK